MSKIALIAATGHAVREWRDAACVEEGEAPWVRHERDLAGRTFSSVICLPGWEHRGINTRLLERLRPQLVAPSPQEIAAEAVQAEREIRAGIMARAVESGTRPEAAAEAAMNARLSEDQFIDQAEAPNLYDSGVGEARGIRDRETAFPSVPVPPANSDESMCRTVIGPALYGRMAEAARGLLADAVRSGNSRHVATLIRDLESIYGMSATRAPPRRTLPLADNFRDVARQERQREAERQERINAGRLRAEEMRRNIRRNLD